MSYLDAALLGAALLLALWSLVASRGQDWRVWAPVGAVAVLAAAQVAIEGVYWQFTPLYLLVILSAGGMVLRPRRRWLAAPIGLLAAASIAAFTVLPVPTLPAPSGPFPIGTKTYRWVDESRPETATDAADDRRNVIVQAWYPAADRASGPTSVYMDGLERLPPKVHMLPGFVLRSFGAVDTRAVVGAPVSPARPRWPVVIFSHGYGAARAFYTGLAAELASRGYIVLALDHPYESALVELADGTLALPIERFLPGDPDRVRYMEQRQSPRVKDIRFVVDRLTADQGLGPLAARPDLSRIIAAGHSFGGSAAIGALGEDPRIVAGADLDGMLRGGVEALPHPRPVLVIESDHQATFYTPLYHARIQALMARAGPGSVRHEIKGANHFSFSDLERFLAPPARPLAGLALGGDRSAAAVQRETVDVLDRFLAKALP